MELTEIELFNGILSIIFVSISFAVGLRIVSKYIKIKQKILLFVGLTWIGLTSVWLAASISILSILITGKGLSEAVYMAIGNAFLPVTGILWVYAVTELLYKKRQKQMLSLLAAYGSAFDIYFLYFLATDISILGEVVGPVDARYNLIVSLFQISCIIIIVFTGLLIAKQSLRSSSSEIVLKGKFLVIAFFAFMVGAILEILSDISIVILIIGRLTLIISAIAFYGGFILPQSFKKLFLKQKSA